jgi:hypothetical protein
MTKKIGCNFQYVTDTRKDRLERLKKSCSNMKDWQIVKKRNGSGKKIWWLMPKE